MQLQRSLGRLFFMFSVCVLVWAWFAFCRGLGLLAFWREFRLRFGVGLVCVLARVWVCMCMRCVDECDWCVRVVPDHGPSFQISL